MLGKEDGLFKAAAVESLIVDGDLGGGAGVQGVEQFRVIQKHRRLVLLGGDGIVDVGKADGFGILAAKLKDPIRPEALDGNGILHGPGDGECVPVLLQCGLQGLNQV